MLSPNKFHKKAALEGIRNTKHVYAEYLQTSKNLIPFVIPGAQIPETQHLEPVVLKSHVFALLQQGLGQIPSYDPCFFAAVQQRTCTTGWTAKLFGDIQSPSTVNAEPKPNAWLLCRSHLV